MHWNGAPQGSLVGWVVPKTAYLVGCLVDYPKDSLTRGYVLLLENTRTSDRIDFDICEVLFNAHLSWLEILKSPQGTRFLKPRLY